MLGIAEFVSRDEKLRIAIKALTDERADLRAQFAEEYDPEVGEVYDASEVGYVVQVQRNATFNAAQARKVLSDADFESILVSKPDSALAKRVLAPVIYEQTQIEGAPKLVVQKVSD